MANPVRRVERGTQQQPNSTERPAATVSICLNMIVRNESCVITRLLDSVRDLVDYWVICDTGSSDDTSALIQGYFRSSGIPGELHCHAWRNFGHNRMQALSLADGKADYILLLDADMVLHRSSAFDVGELTADSYIVRQDAGDISYYNTRLIRSGLRWTCVGPTHEYYVSPRARAGAKLDTLWIEDVGDGGCKSEKFERDIELLEREINVEPDNARYHFYLGESYRNTGRMQKAVDAYQRRIELGGWDEETWYAMYMKGAALAALGRGEAASATLRDACRYRPWRAESLLALVQAARESGDYETAVSLAEQGRRLGYPEDDVLFVDRSAYEWRFDHELTISGFHAGRRETGRTACERLLARRDLPGYIRANVLRNLVFYVPKLSDLAGKPVQQQVLDTCDARWRYTNPSVCRRDAGGYWLNLRQVNYRVKWPVYSVRETGAPIDDSHPATTENVLVALNEDLRVVDAGYRIDVRPGDAPSYACHARGYEDGRLFCFQGALWLSAHVLEHSEDGLCRICLLKIDDAGDDAGGASMVRLRGPRDGTRHEKNWMPFVHDDVLHYVYACDPLTILRVDPGTGRCTAVSEEASPICCEDFRGGSQGIPFDDGYLFVIHQVAEDQTWRGYVHRFMLIGTDLTLKAVSDAFCLNSPAIEFVAGLAADARSDTLVLSWGCNDERSMLTRIPTRAVRGLLRRCPPRFNATGR